MFPTFMNLVLMVTGDGLDGKAFGGGVWWDAHGAAWATTLW
jgi:hypothetical protein